MCEFILLIEHMADCVSVIWTSGNDEMLVAVPQAEVSGWPADNTQ